MKLTLPVLSLLAVLLSITTRAQVPATSIPSKAEPKSQVNPQLVTNPGRIKIADTTSIKIKTLQDDNTKLKAELAALKKLQDDNNSKLKDELGELKKQSEQNIKDLKFNLKLLGTAMETTTQVMVQIEANDQNLTNFPLPNGATKQDYDAIKIDHPFCNNNPSAKIVITQVVPGTNPDYFGYNSKNLGGVVYAYFHPKDKSWYIILYKNVVEGMISNNTHFSMKFVNVKKGDIYNVLISK